MIQLRLFRCRQSDPPHPSLAISSPLTLPRAVEPLDTILGVDQRGAEVIMMEIGIARARFETAPHLAAWAGVAPGNDESAGSCAAAKPVRAIAPEGQCSPNSPMLPCAPRVRMYRGYINASLLVVGSSGLTEIRKRRTGSGYCSHV